ncbi:hypothetical protein ARMGADRAFT_943534, partial [Armillaria gallica]
HTFNFIRSAGSAIYNYKNPVRRDVVNIDNAGDNVTVRYMTDNPGPWFLHYGLTVVFVEAVEDWNSTMNPTYHWDQLCTKYDMPAEDL